MTTSLADSMADLPPRVSGDERVIDEVSDCAAHCAKLAIDPFNDAEQRGNHIAFGRQLEIAANPGAGSYSLQAYGFRGGVRDV